MYSLSEKSRSNMMGIDPRLRQIAERAIQITVVDFGIPESGGVRTAVEQHELFKAFRSKCDGYDKKSNHQIKEGNAYGKAVDFYAYINRFATWDEKHMAMIACAFLQAACELGYNIEWGGLWKSFEDMPHIQIKGIEDDTM